MGSRSEHIANARKLTRTFASAPDQRRRALDIVQELARVPGLSSGERTALLNIQTWISERPPPGQLKARCEALIAGFG